MTEPHTHTHNGNSPARSGSRAPRRRSDGPPESLPLLMSALSLRNWRGRGPSSAPNKITFRHLYVQTSRAFLRLVNQNRNFSFFSVFLRPRRPTYFVMKDVIERLSSLETSQKRLVRCLLPKLWWTNNSSVCLMMAEFQP